MLSLPLTFLLCLQATPPATVPPPAQALDLHLVSRGVIDVPAQAPEIVAVSRDHRLLVHTDASSKTLEIYRASLPQQADGRLVPFDFDPSLPGPQGVAFPQEPTSVALHPSQPIALVCVLGAETDARGSVHAIDLREASLGQSLWFEEVGCHPDSIAISADGRWAVSANEGENDERGGMGQGSISVLRLDTQDLLEHRRFNARLKVFELDVHEGIAADAQDLEPEFVAIDPKSRFAIVTCQENDAAVAIDLRGETPVCMAPKLFLPRGSEPDGCAVLDGFVDPKLGAGALVAFAEEGRLDADARWCGQSASFYWFGPEGEFSRFEFLGRADIGRLLAKPQEELSPEGVVLWRQQQRVMAAVGVERDNSVLLFELGNPRQPRWLDRCPVGKRPEGLVVVSEGERCFLVTGDEGKSGPGQVSFVEVLSKR